MVHALIFVAVLLLAGVLIRNSFSIFATLYIPASVLAGVIGLMVIQLGLAFDAPATSEWSTTLRGWPGWLIAVVFAGMLLERRPSSFRESLSRVGREGLMVWVIALGQTAVGLLATWLVVQPFYDVPNSFGSLIETGFAGGHGTAAAMGQVFAHPSIDLAGGLDLGILMATCGLVYGLISGILWVNIGARAGWVQAEEPPRSILKSPAQEPSTDRAQQELESESDLRPIGYARISGGIVDPLLLQVIWLALAFGVGLLFQSIANEAAGFIESWMRADASASDIDAELSKRLGLRAMVESFPLFIYTLFGGLAVRLMLRRVGRESWIDRETINRLTSTAMDILVVAAVATLNLQAVATLIVPFSILFVGGAIWSAICLLVFARWLLPREHWFELGLINYGMSTGTTATGFVLLRLVDPELESGAAEDYALAAPLSSPFVGGGMLTVGLPLLVLESFPIALTSIALCIFVVLMLVLGKFWNTS
jgi:ESS family glutamate:Na+ symporter